MNVGDQVKNVATGEAGIVVGHDGGQFFEIALASGRLLIHEDDLGLVPRNPAEVLASGQTGHGEAYGLRASKPCTSSTRTNTTL